MPRFEMMDEEQQRRLRRKLAGLVLLIGALAIGARFFSLSGRLSTIELRYELGDPPVARSIAATVVRAQGGAEVARFRAEDVRPVLRQKIPLATGTYRVEVTLVGTDGLTRRLVRTIEVSRDAEISLDLKGDQ